MTEKEKKFTIIGSNSLLTKYKQSDKDLTIHVKRGDKFTGKIRWFDDYAIKIALNDGTGSITVPIHNMLYYECEKFVLPGETEAKITPKVFRGVNKSTDKERDQLEKYKSRKELIRFHLEKGEIITGKLNWYLDHIYSVKSEEDKKDYQIVKRNICYYKKLDPPKPDRTDRGIIKMVNKEKGFGFIIYEQGDLFFHRSELEGTWEELEGGQPVEFAVSEGKKGMVAVNVKVIN